MSMRKKLAVLTVVVAVVGAALRVSAADDAESGLLRESAARVAVGTCAGCHGARGVSEIPKFPNLAGQNADYLAAQLRAFRERTRREPDALAYMWGMAASLDDRQIVPIAEYYAAQSPAGSTPADPADASRGRSIYDAGIPSQHVVPCLGCHGPKGEGNVGPRLAGQKVVYFVAQMHAFQHHLRESAVMQPLAAGLAEDDLEALAAYIESL